MGDKDEGSLRGEGSRGILVCRAGWRNVGLCNGCEDWSGSGLGERSPSGGVLEAMECFSWEPGAVGCEGHLLGVGALLPGPCSHSPAATMAEPFSTSRVI